MLALQVYAPALLNLGKSVLSVSSFYSLLHLHNGLPSNDDDRASNITEL